MARKTIHDRLVDALITRGERVTAIDRPATRS